MAEDATGAVPAGARLPGVHASARGPSVAFASLPPMSLRLAGLLLLLHIVVGWAFLHDTGPGFPLDDAWGHMVYARALATGEGFAYNPGQAEAGVSSPLWTTLAAVPCHRRAWLFRPMRPSPT